MSSLVSLLSPRGPLSPIAWRHGQPITAERFLQHVALLANDLPRTGAMVNLCADRYAFMVAFAAACSRGQPSLLPPDALPATLAHLPEDAGGLYFATDPDSGARFESSHAAAVVVDVARLQACANSLPPSPDHGGSVPAIPDSMPAAVLLTSGSTGRPMPHTKTAGALMKNGLCAARRLAAALGRPSMQEAAPLEGLAIVATVPAQHSYGFESSVLLALAGGAALEAGRPFYPADVATALAGVPEPRALVTTPFHLKAILASELDLPRVELILSATAPLSPQLAQQAEQRFGGMLVEIYGCTEAGQVATRRTVESAAWETFEDLHIREERPSADAVLHDASDASSDTPAVRYVVEGGYVQEPTVLADVLQLQGSTRFELLGRSNDIIHVGGRRSSLAHLEHHLNSIEGVADGAFWMPPDVADGIVRPVAFVVAPGLGAPEIIAALRERLEAVFVPRRVIHVPSLPRIATGKLTRQAIAELAASHGLAGTAGQSA